MGSIIWLHFALPVEKFIITYLFFTYIYFEVQLIIVGSKDKPDELRLSISVSLQFNFKLFIYSIFEEQLVGGKIGLLIVLTVVYI